MPWILFGGGEVSEFFSDRFWVVRDFEFVDHALPSVVLFSQFGNPGLKFPNLFLPFVDLVFFSSVILGQGFLVGKDVLYLSFQVADLSH